MLRTSACEERCEQSHEVEDASHVEVEDFLTAFVGRGFEGAAPCCAGVGDEDVDAVFGFDFGEV